MPQRFFFIRSGLNGLVLDVSENKKAPGAHVITWHKKNQDNCNQLWFEESVTGTIRSKLCPQLCLTAGGDNHIVLDNVQRGNSNQRWHVVGDRVQNRDDHSRVFDIVGQNAEPGARICAWQYHGGANQQWEFDYVQPKYFYLVSEMHGKVLDVKDNNSAPGATICMWNKNDRPSDNQLWYQDCEGLIRSKLTDFVLDSRNNDLIVVKPYDGSPHQRWTLSGNKIVRQDNPGRVLDISGENRHDGATLCEYGYKNQSHQHWKLAYIN